MSALSRSITFMPQVFPISGTPASPIAPFFGIEPTNGIPDNGEMNVAQTVGTNLARLIQSARDGEIQGPDGVLALEAASGIGKSTIYRILSTDAANDPTVLTAQKLAEAYGLDAWQLLVPHVDPSDPPTVLSPKEREEIAIMRVVFQQVQAVASGHGLPDLPRTSRPGNNSDRAGPNTGPKSPHKDGKSKTD